MIAVGRGIGRWIGVGVVATVVGGIAGSALAAAPTRCGDRQTLVRVDTKQCKATRFRAAITVSRACCENAKGRIRCKPFKKCPRKSPSA